MQRVYVPLRTQELERLVALAHQERRRPQEQAAFLISQALDASTVSGNPRDDSRPLSRGEVLTV